MSLLRVPAPKQPCALIYTLDKGQKFRAICDYRCLERYILEERMFVLSAGRRAENHLLRSRNASDLESLSRNNRQHVIRRSQRGFKDVAATQIQRTHTSESYSVAFQPTRDGGRGRLDARYQYQRKVQPPLGASYRGLQLSVGREVKMEIPA